MLILTGSQDASPTKTLYSELQRAYDTFNQRLFNGKLERCLITLQRQANTMGYLSYKRFAATANKDDFVHELALNPEYFGVTPILETMQTIVHEQSHLLTMLDGTASQKNYHNQAWADLMESVGLMPSSTGRIGGKRVGQKMADYPIKGGLFLAVCAELFENNYNVSWYDRFPPKKSTQASMLNNHNFVQMFSEELPSQALSIPNLDIEAALTPSYAADKPHRPTLDDSAEQETPKPPTNQSKLKYHCDGCNANVWGKPALNIICGDCEEPFKRCD